MTKAEVIWSESMLQGLFWHHLSIILMAKAGIVPFDSMLQGLADCSGKTRLVPHVPSSS